MYYHSREQLAQFQRVETWGESRLALSHGIVWGRTKLKTNVRNWTLAHPPSSLQDSTLYESINSLLEVAQSCAYDYDRTKKPKRLKNHTLWGRTFLCNPYKGVPRGLQLTRRTWLVSRPCAWSALNPRTARSRDEPHLIDFPATSYVSQHFMSLEELTCPLIMKNCKMRRMPTFSSRTREKQPRTARLEARH